MFAMNMFGTTVNVGQSVSTPTQVTGKNDPLGYDMFFQQMKTGEIPKVWYQKGDSSYYVNVKLGAINAFQTHVVASGKTEKVLEADPVGSHFSNLKGSGSDKLSIVKTFTEDDFKSFPDAKLKKGNLKLIATTTTTVHSAGYIMGSSVDQQVTMVKMAQLSSMSKQQTVQQTVGASDTGLNSDLSSKGHLGITLLQASLTDEDSVFDKPMTREELQNNPDFVGNSMFDTAAWLVQMHELEVPDIDLIEAMEIIVDSNTDHKTADVLAMKVSKYLAVRTDDVHLMEIYAAQLATLSPVARSRLLAILAELPSQKFLIEYGLLSPLKDLVISSAFATLNAKIPSPRLMSVLEELAFESEDIDINEAAVLSYTAIIGDAEGVPVSPQLLIALQYIDKISEDEAVTIMHAVGNAGPKVIPFDLFPVAAFQSSSPFVRAAAVHALRQYIEDPAAVALLYKLNRYDTAQVVRVAAWRVISENSLDLTFERPFELVAGSDFPFNQSFDKSITIGGKVVNAKFAALLFAGTNFDCRQQYFNYKAQAEATVDVELFGFKKQAFIAEAIYGKQNGALVGDKIYLKVWDKVLYEKQIPSLDCKEHTYPIASTTKGLDVSYTLWVSVIPVTFSAGGKLTLTLSWGWSICDADLSAMVELIPAATFTIYGQAEINLLIIRAGLELAGSFNTRLPPQGYIHGSQCQIGLNLKQVSDPMAIDFTSYYAWKKCKFIFFDCHWADHNQQTWFHWSMAPVNKVLYDKHWDIKK